MAIKQIEFIPERIEELKKEYAHLLSPEGCYKYNGNNGKPWKDTKRFSPAANYFLETQRSTGIGTYCPYVEGTIQYTQFWDLEEFRIHNGLILDDGQWITGLNYLYLNYCPIYDKLRGMHTFPKFIDGQAAWFKELKETITDREHFCGVKKRQFGSSFINAVPLTYNFYFVPSSINYIGSFIEAQGLKTWNMMKYYFNWLNAHTDFYKNRAPDTDDHTKAAFIEISEGKKIELGYLSEVYRVCFKDNATKGVGGAITYFFYEEPGIAPNLKATANFVLPAMKAGNIYTGTFVCQGSVGELKDSKDLETYFNKPELYSFHSVINIWEPGKVNHRCGYFIPEFVYYEPYIDEDGNSDIISAIYVELINREKERQKSTRDYVTYISQHPFTPSECFMSRGIAKFPVEELKEHLSRLETVDELTNYGYAVKLHEDESGNVKIQMKPDSKPYEEYPVKNVIGLEGCTWIYEPPVPDATYNLYIGGVDSVDQNIAPTSDSVFVSYIYKKDSGVLAEFTKREIVCSIIGRPEIIDDFYEETRLALKLYNGKALVENSNIGIINHFKYKDSWGLLQDQMDEIKGLNPNSVVKREKGFHPTPETDIHGDELIKKYLLEKIGLEIDEETGDVIRKRLGLERIKDKGLIKELIEYNDKDNFDRITAFRACLLYEEATQKREVIKKEDTQSAYAVLADTSRFYKKRRIQ